MKILHLTKRFPNAVGGDGVVVSHIVQHQRMRGHKAHILTSNCPAILRQAYVKKFGLGIADKAIDNIGISRIVTLLGLALYSFWFLRKLRPDVIHSHTLDFGFAVSFAARFYRIPIVNTCHSVTFTQPQFPNWKRKLEAWLLRAGRYNMVITVDATAVQALKDIGIKNAMFMPNGVEVGEFRPHRPSKDGVYRLIFVARIVKDKGLHHLLEALQQINDKMGSYELAVVGDGPEVDYYKQMAKDLGLGNHVRFVGRKHGSRLRWYFEGADMFVMPSLHEAFPLVVVEAMAARLPAVITDVGSVPVFCTNLKDSMIVKSGDSKALAKAILTVRQDPKLAEKIAANGRALVDAHYTYRKVTDNIEALYKELLA